jgi:hypothetical protein
MAMPFLLFRAWLFAGDEMVSSHGRVSVRGNLFHWASFAESQMQRCGDDGEMGKGKLWRDELEVIPASLRTLGPRVLEGLQHVNLKTSAWTALWLEDGMGSWFLRLLQRYPV